MESILAAALQRVGKRVLNIDPSPRYGDYSAGIPLCEFVEWAQGKLRTARQKKQANEEGGPAAGEVGWVLDTSAHEDFIALDFCDDLAEPIQEDEDEDDEHANEKSCLFPSSSIYDSVELRLGYKRRECGDRKKKKKQSEAQREAQIIRTQSRSFLIDFSSSLVFSRGAMVDILVSSDVASYVQFLPLEGVYVDTSSSVQPYSSSSSSYREDDLIRVPCHKKDVFISRSLSMLEKRATMKFLQ